MTTQFGIDRAGPATAATLAERPMRFVEAELNPLEEGGAMLTVTNPPRRRIRDLGFAKRARSFEFDAISAFVWRCIDGRSSVAGIVDRLARRFDLSLRDAQVPTLQILHMLTREGLVGVPESARRHPPMNACRLNAFR